MNKEIKEMLKAILEEAMGMCNPTMSAMAPYSTGGIAEEPKEEPKEESKYEKQSNGTQKAGEYRLPYRKMRNRFNTKVQ